LAISWSERARADLGAIFARIAADSGSAAEGWISNILKQAELAAEAPLLGRIVPELGQRTFEKPYLGSYRIAYRADGQDLWVLTVFEWSRQSRSSDIDD
jgi:plasmid stabilization system protein ParE